MVNRDLLKEAIADAKAVKETAIVNAKAALEEAFTPYLKEKLAAKLAEMDEMDEAKEEMTEMKEKDMKENYDMDEAKEMDEATEMDEAADMDEAKEMEENLTLWMKKIHLWKKVKPLTSTKRERKLVKKKQ